VQRTHGDKACGGKAFGDKAWLGLVAAQNEKQMAITIGSNITAAKLTSQICKPPKLGSPVNTPNR
jgi:hypothetical protein